MIFTEPMPFEEALNAAKVRTILPTTGKSRDLQRLEPDIKRRALWMATVTQASALQRVDDVTKAIVDGKIDQTTARLQLKQMFSALGYQPNPEKMGSIEDLSSDRRLNLVIETNVQTAQGYGWREQGMQADVADEFPAVELYRAFGPKDPAAERDWAARWAQVGGAFYDGRMIALRTDPIWARLGDPANFDDALGNDYPPFAYNSGMDVRDISRDEAEQLGLIDGDTRLTPEPIDLNADLKAKPDVRAGWLRSALEETGLGRFDGDVFTFTDGGGS